MKINADFTQRVVVHAAQLEWIASPMPGVDRRPLDRVGGEVARATSIVRYAPGSHFSPHVHTGGEEFLVLEGVFQDEHGNFPAGSYIRNPPQSRHTPGSDPGCVLFVKLWQFDPDDRAHVQLNTKFMQAVPHRELAGVATIPLYHDTRETVSLIEMQALAGLTLDVPGGAELLILDGEIEESGDRLTKYSWLRLPCDGSLRALAGNRGARIWMKIGHLADVAEQLARLPPDQR